MKMFQEAMFAKQHAKGTPFGREEFDKWTGDYDVRLVTRVMRLYLIVF